MSSLDIGAIEGSDSGIDGMEESESAGGSTSGAGDRMGGNSGGLLSKLGSGGEPVLSSGNGGRLGGGYTGEGESGSVSGESGDGDSVARLKGKYRGDRGAPCSGSGDGANDLTSSWSVRLADVAARKSIPESRMALNNSLQFVIVDGNDRTVDAAVEEFMGEFLKRDLFT